jgi:hypothetical protein
MPRSPISNSIVVQLLLIFGICGVKRKDIIAPSENVAVHVGTRLYISAIGLHLTYRCNTEWEHCAYHCGSGAKDPFKLVNAKMYLGRSLTDSRKKVAEHVVTSHENSQSALRRRCKADRDGQRL